MPKKSPKSFKYLVGGVNSPLRAFGAVGGNPLTIKAGWGARIRDIEGQEYLDYTGSYGALILGHAPPRVVAAAKIAVARGSSFGATTPPEAELAEEICRAFPSIEQVRLTNSGTEAVMGALKLAKAFTNRSKVIKFKECYHGWAEQQYLEAEFNNLGSVGSLISKGIAAIIVEPVAGNCGVIPPRPGFLKGLREMCDRSGALLIFDEVITGFRLARGGAQEYYGVRADLTCLGKIIGGGFPVGAFGGRREIMRLLAPEGPIYQAGTFSGNPVTVAAGLSVLRTVKKPGFYEKLEEKAEHLAAGIKIITSRVGSMFSFRVDDYPGFFWKALRKGIYFAPSLREANFISAAHTWQDIEKTIEKAG